MKAPRPLGSALESSDWRNETPISCRTATVPRPARVAVTIVHVSLLCYCFLVLLTTALSSLLLDASGCYANMLLTVALATWIHFLMLKSRKNLSTDEAKLSKTLAGLRTLGAPGRRTFGAPPPRVFSDFSSGFFRV